MTLIIKNITPKCLSHSSLKFSLSKSTYDDLSVSTNNSEQSVKGKATIDIFKSQKKKCFRQDVETKFLVEYQNVVKPDIENI